MMTTQIWWCLPPTCSCLWLQTQGLVAPPSAICTARLQPSDQGQITMCEDFETKTRSAPFGEDNSSLVAFFLLSIALEWRKILTISYRLSIHLTMSNRVMNLK